ncbi:MAG: DegT/DnrJ/EryC1/StrS family aminotransferase [Bacteroidales bacterium]
MITKPIPYGHQNITEEDIKAVVETLKSDYLTQGPKITEFEKAFAKYVGAEYAVAVCNATAALHIAAMAAGVNIDKDTYLMDINKLRTLLQSSPKGTYKGVIPVDFAGYPHKMEEFKALADEYGMWIIEDACHAPGGWFSDSKNEKQLCGNGKNAQMTIFSFHPVKHIATGEGGMVTTNDKDLYNKLCLYRSHGITKDSSKLEKNDGAWYYEMQELGYNYRITDFQAALGISQLKRANAGINRRNEIAKRYTEAFSECDKIKTPFVANDVFHAYHLYIIQTDDRNGLFSYLRKNNILVQVHYYPLHLMPYYKQFGTKEGDFPIVERYYKHCVSLPMFPTLTEEEQEYVIEKVKEYIH